jgi:hypothetical protein
MAAFINKVPFTLKRSLLNPSLLMNQQRGLQYKSFHGQHTLSIAIAKKTLFT